MPFVQSISNRDITSLGLPRTRESPVHPEPAKSSRHSMLMQSNGLWKNIPKNGLLLYAKLRTTKITVKKKNEIVGGHA